VTQANTNNKSGPARRRWSIVYAAVIANAVITIFLLAGFSRYFSG
jgi:hypothetical protein